MMKLPECEIEAIKNVLDASVNWIERELNTVAVANIRAVADYIERRDKGGKPPTGEQVLDIIDKINH